MESTTKTLIISNIIYSMLEEKAEEIGSDPTATAEALLYLGLNDYSGAEIEDAIQTTYDIENEKEI